MNGNLSQFLTSLDQVLPYVSGIIFIAGTGLLIGYLIKIWSIGIVKDRYDFISMYEIRILWNSSILIIISLAFYPKNFVSGDSALWKLVEYFIEIMLAIILGTIAYYTLKFYYPNYMNKRLKNLRYKPRISPKTGKPMKLLTEEEEDVYLDEGMQAEEDVFSIDYDVWIDEETGFTQIEKYSGKLTAKECPRCGYQTLKVEKEELIIAPTAFASGELMKRYKCTYCGHKEKEIFKVAKLTEEH
jgi:DNA-directed RNA polymerase subunit RPC12/RpoP